MKAILEMELPKSTGWDERWKLILSIWDQYNPLFLESKTEPQGFTHQYEILN